MTMMNTQIQAIKVAVFGNKPSKQKILSQLSKLSDIIQCVDTLDHEIAIFYIQNNKEEHTLTHFQKSFPNMPIIAVTSCELQVSCSAIISEPLTTDKLIKSIESIVTNKSSTNPTVKKINNTRPGNPQPLQVVIMAKLAQRRKKIAEIITEQGIQVSAMLGFVESDLQQINVKEANVLIAELDDDESGDIDFIFDYEDLPVIFCDQESLTASGIAEWVRKITLTDTEREISDQSFLDETLDTIQEAAEHDELPKLMNITESAESDLKKEIAVESILKDTNFNHAQMAQIYENEPPSLLDIIDTPWEKTSSVVERKQYSNVQSMTLSEFDDDEELEDCHKEINTIWILAASIGAPPMVKQFLHATPKNLTTSFILAQHIGANFLPDMAQRLNQSTAHTVRPAVESDRILQSGVLVVPTDKEFNVDADGKVMFSPITNHRDYTPNIDHVIDQVLNRYAEFTNIIIFSGLGKDSIKGAQKIAESGGQVWTLDAASCVVGKMPAAAHELGIVNYSGNPKQLAMRLTQKS